jgi:tRNA 2-thiocytidine biosynthesis protein TtcA
MLKKSHQNFITQVRKTAGRAINRYELVKAGDRVLVALSGGKDSLVLLDTITERLRYLPIRYEVAAAHVVIECMPRQADEAYLGEFCAERGVTLHTRTVQGEIDFSRGSSPCFVCSWHRRKVLFGFMKELGCTRLAFGHHQDDIVETMIMNMAIHGKICAMPMRLSMFGGQFDLIRPLGLLAESEIARYAKLKGFTIGSYVCPHGLSSKRAETKRIVREMQTLSRYARHNIFVAPSHIDAEYLP